MAADGISSYYTSSLRLTGLGGSGLDTDTVVRQLMNAEEIPLTRLYQKKQLAEWRQEAYRDITNMLREFKDKYFNMANPLTNLLSSSSFKSYAAASSDSSYVTVAGSAGSVAGSHTVSVVKLATAGKAVSGGRITDSLEGKAVSNFNLSGKKARITLDGVTREIKLDNYDSSGSDIISKAGTGLQSLVDDAFGAGKITVSFNEATNKLTFDTAGGASRLTLLSGSSDDGLAALGFRPEASNRLDIQKSLESLSTVFKNDLKFNEQGKLVFTINSKKFEFDKSVSLSSMMNTINSDAQANVNIKYDEASDKFVITSKQYGYGENILIDEDAREGNFFGEGGASGILAGGATTEHGTDASAIIDGQLVTRSSNTFTFNGTVFTLVKEHSNPDTESETVSLKVDADKVYENIKGFVDKYNEIIDKINKKLTEKYNRNYQPLTDKQKDDMTENQIKKWEEIAKTGLLKGDSILQNIVYDMRRALSDGISGISESLSSIGITTGDYSEKGKLIINESKLKEAIRNNPDAVSDLFTKDADISYSEANTSELRATRYANQGLANRLCDILDDNIRTVGGKGRLLERAGMQGDSTEYSNYLYKQIDDYEDDIIDMLNKLTEKENRYYAKFTAMEKYLSQMNAQSAWLYSQFNNS